MNTRINTIVEDAEDKISESACPFTTVKYLQLGAYMQGIDDDISYECEIDGKAARGGNIAYCPPYAYTPCNMEFARTCPLYKAYAAIPGFVNMGDEE